VFLFFILLCFIQLLCILTWNVHAPTDQIVNVRAAFAELNHGFRGWETRFSQASKSLAFFLSATSQSHYTAPNRQKGRRCSARLNDSKRLCATRHPHEKKCVPLNQHFISLILTFAFKPISHQHSSANSLHAKRLQMSSSGSSGHLSILHQRQLRQALRPLKTQLKRQRWRVTSVRRARKSRHSCGWANWRVWNLRGWRW
jgi:hypothetical protein